MVWPESLSLTGRLREVFAAEEGFPPKRFTFEHLLQKGAPAAPADLAVALASLGAEGVVQQAIVVNSVEGGEIEEFHSLDEVPSTIRDTFRDEEITVRPEMLTVVYKSRSARLR